MGPLRHGRSYKTSLWKGFQESQFTEKKSSEISNFKQDDVESLFGTREKFKLLLKNF